MASVIYRGYADLVRYNGQEYRRNETADVSDKDVAYLTRLGHRFERVKPAKAPAPAKPRRRKRPSTRSTTPAGTDAGSGEE